MTNKIIEYISFVKEKYTQKYYNIGFASFMNDIQKLTKIRNVKWLNNPNANKW